MEKPQAQAHVVLFPYLAQGHISPFLSLANRLHRCQPGLTITLVSTPHHISSIRPLLPTDLRINLHSLPFRPADHGLPAGVESTADLPVAHFITFFKATESLYPAFDDYIGSLVSNSSDCVPLCIVSDLFFSWAVDIAHKHGVFHTTFLTMGAFGGAVYLSVRLNLPHAQIDNNRFSLPEYPDIIIDRSQLSKAILDSDGMDERFLFIKRQIMFLHETDAMLINTVEEFEPLGLGMLRRTYKFPIWAIGPLLALSHQPTSSEPELEAAILDFLDLQLPASVLYICFGSQNTIQPEQMMQLAQGLECSGCAFIWVIKPPIGSDPRGEFRDEWLPHGFKDRITQKRTGLIVHGWASQLKILGHRSTGAFLSHCGWNSILESLTHGVPIITWPVDGDQFFNSMMLVESGLAVELARGVTDSLVPTKEEVKEVVNLVMGSNVKGMKIRRQTKECRDVMCKALDEDGGPSTKSLLDFVQAINTAAGTD